MTKKLPASTPRIALTPAEAAAVIGVGPGVGDSFDEGQRGRLTRLREQLWLQRALSYGRDHSLGRAR